MERVARSDGGEFSPHDPGTLDHGAHLSIGDFARKIFQPAIGRDYNLRRRHIRQRTADAGSDGLGLFDRHVGKIECAEYDRLARELFQHEQSSFDCAVSIETCCTGDSASSDRNE
jgi:hypothetical protein